MSDDPRPPPATGVDDEELHRLRAEVLGLRAAVDRRAHRAVLLRGLRQAVAAVLVTLSAFCAVATVVGVWAGRTALDTDRWVRTVGPLPKDPRVAAAVAEYSTAQLFAVLNVESRLREALPERAAFVAGPVTGQLREYLRQRVDGVLASDRFQAVWLELNRRAHRQVVSIVEGRSAVVRAGVDRVTIDLLPLVNQVLRDLEANLPTLFGRRLDLPDLTSGQIPPNLRSAVESAVGVSLPADFARFTVYDAGRLWALQRAVSDARRAVLALLAASVVFAVAALWLSPRRRRTVLLFGAWLAVAVVVMTASLRAVRADLLARVPAGTYRDGADAALTTVFAGLRDRGGQLLWAGILLALVAYLVGPGRLPVALRTGAGRAATGAATAVRRHAPGLSDRARAFTRDHLDPLRVAGVVVAGLAAVLVASWSGLLVTLVLLGLYQVLLTVVARTAPRGAPGSAAAAGA